MNLMKSLSLITGKDEFDEESVTVNRKDDLMKSVTHNRKDDLMKSLSLITGKVEFDEEKNEPYEESVTDNRKG